MLSYAGMRSLMALTFVALTLGTVACGSSPTAPGPSGGIGAPTGAASASEADLTFCVTEANQYRASIGKAPLTRSSTLEAYAATGAHDDGLAHTGHGHFHTAPGVARAENEIPWWAHLASVHEVMQQGLAQMWAEGPGGGHYENLRGPYTEVGCGVFRSGSEITVVQDFR